LDSPPERIEFHYEENGKPFLSDQSLPIRFNVSHSGGIAGCAISFVTDVGLDIEQLRPKPDLLQLASRFFHPSEFDWIASLPVSGQLREFYRTWVRKEACIKAVGGSIFASVNQALPASGWRVHEFVPAVGYVGALAVRAEGPLEVVQHPLVNAGLLIP
jgi:4'-phosphopantetheinyl transferase